MDPDKLDDLIKKMQETAGSAADATGAAASDALKKAQDELGDLASPALPQAPGNLQGLFGAPSKGKSLSVSLPGDLLQFVNGLVASGQYLDSGEVLRDAVRRLQCDPCFSTPSASCGSNKGNASAHLNPNGMSLHSSALSPYDALPSGWLRIQSTSGDLPPDVAALVGLRRLLAQVERDVEANERHSGGPLELSYGVGSEREYMYLMSPVAAKDTAQGWRLAPLRTVERGVTTVTQLKAVAEEVTARLNDLAEEMSLRLQMAVDSRSKMFTTLSNVMKKLDESRQQIINNMK